ncbi:NAD-dependent succinate-semialdehyde dehydrogenase [Gulosibacter macacae]|uniref:NAD-dependent succinate-semialdehyde dehydrogenase n=1 Tax=Gulosibacter macacae TaxID=2488791 RepID=A0A3P3W154_9MICO|nr:NAD-dependent succinate-semialdehyde dehydrogenase [Gulosibacter macacae]RRJ87616.1 NAD-dependent succinate-semialdehyde dehydrogenase [Gulosibacter macacae]
MSYRTTNPATNEVEREFALVAEAEIETAIATADAEYRIWSARPLAERVSIIKRVAEIYRERRDELAEIISREMGKPIAFGRGEVGISADIFDYYANNAETFLEDEELTVASGGRALVRTAPIGVLLGIMPWNYPYYQVARFAAPNLLLGNTIILKHASNCPESAAAIAQIFEDAGLPAGAYINLYVSSRQVPAIIADDRVQGVSITGSEAAGRAVAEVAGRHLKKCVTELGGNDPYIVLSTDDLDGAVKGAVLGRMANGGQACNASKRAIVVDDLYDDFVEKYVARMAKMIPGDPLDNGTRFGPLASSGAVDELIEIIDDAVAKGATLHTGGKRIDRPGAWMEATVLTDVTPEMRAYHEEMFGPVGVIYRVDGEQAAIDLANDSPYGLGSSVTTTDPEQADRVANALETGMVVFDGPGDSEPDLPFGGVKASGIGRELARFGMEEFANKKLLRWRA